MGFALFVIVVAIAAAIRGWYLAMSRVPTTTRQYSLGVTSEVLADAMAMYRTMGRLQKATHTARSVAPVAAVIRPLPEWQYALQERYDQEAQKEWASTHNYRDTRPRSHGRGQRSKAKA